jgi:hypothetical protein
VCFRAVEPLIVPKKFDVDASSRVWEFGFEVVVSTVGLDFLKPKSGIPDMVDFRNFLSCKNYTLIF